MSKANKTYKINNLFYNTKYNSQNNNIYLNDTENKVTSNALPILHKSYSNNYYNNIFNNNLILLKNKNNDMNKISKTFYSIKRQVHHLMPKTKSVIYKCNTNKCEKIAFKNVFHHDSFEKIWNKNYNNELNEEFDLKRKNYNLLLLNLIKKNRDSKIGELNIKFDFINKIGKNILKKKKETRNINNQKILKIFKQTNYSNFKKDINETLVRRNKIDKEIKDILDNVEARFDNIFINTMDKKYNLNQLNQIKQNEKFFTHSKPDFKFKI